MGMDAGLQGQALQDFVSSGGTLGSTAAGGGGVGSNLLQNIPQTPTPPTSLPNGTQSPAPVQSGPTNPGIGVNGSVPGTANGSSLSQLLQQFGMNPSLANLLGGSGGTGDGSGGSGLIGAGLSALPSYLALNYANNLPQPNIGAYTDLYNKAGDTSGLLGTYDLNTGAGRNQLNSSLTARGVAGSSFGDQAINNFDYTSGLGRADLLSKGISQGAQTGAGINTQAINAINARNLSSNALIGAGLNASGQLFNPVQNDQFNLKNLFGVAV